MAYLLSYIKASAMLDVAKMDYELLGYLFRMKLIPADDYRELVQGGPVHKGPRAITNIKENWYRRRRGGGI
jgi:hypothetical protein